MMNLVLSFLGRVTPRMPVSSDTRRANRSSNRGTPQLPMLPLLAITALCGTSGAMSAAAGGVSQQTQTVPLVHLSSETIALLHDAGQNPSRLRAVARISGTTSIAGSVDSRYTTRFPAFPKHWQTAEISVGYRDGGPLFEKIIVNRVQPRRKIDAVSTAAVIAADGRLLKTLLYEEAIRKAVNQAGRGQFTTENVQKAKVAIMTAVITRNIIAGTLSGDIDTYLDLGGPQTDLKLAVPDHETGVKVTVNGHAFSPNAFGIRTSQSGLLPRGARPYLAEHLSLTGGLESTPYPRAPARASGARAHRYLYRPGYRSESDPSRAQRPRERRLGYLRQPSAGRLAVYPAQSSDGGCRGRSRTDRLGQSAAAA